MKIQITGFNPFGNMETEDHELKPGKTIHTRLMPVSISVDDDSGIVFDYETSDESDQTTLPDKET